MSPIRVVLFDLGETLVQVPKPAPRYRELLADHGHHLSLSEVEAMLAEGRRRQEAQHSDWVSPDLELDREAAVARRTIHVDTLVELAGGGELLRQAFEALWVGPSLFTLYPEVPETLAALHAAGYKLGIVSNWESRLPELCAAHGIAHYFSCMVVSEIEGLSKPHRGLYERALAHFGADPAETVHVGDKLHEDVAGATAVGIRAILLDRADTQADAHPWRIRTLSEVLPLLQGFS